MRIPLALLMVLVVFAAGTTLAMATGSGGNNGTPGHNEKPGCGPDKTDGDAGASGVHMGQPPKADNRQDCPNPPGQQGNTTGTGNNKTSSSATTSSTSSSSSSSNKKK